MDILNNKIVKSVVRKIYEIMKNLHIHKKSLGVYFDLVV